MVFLNLSLSSKKTKFMWLSSGQPGAALAFKACLIWLSCKTSIVVTGFRLSVSQMSRLMRSKIFLERKTMVEAEYLRPTPPPISLVGT